MLISLDQNSSNVSSDDRALHVAQIDCIYCLATKVFVRYKTEGKDWLIYSNCGKKINGVENCDRVRVNVTLTLTLKNCDRVFC